MTTRRVITAGIAMLLSVAVLSSCSGEKPSVPEVPKHTASASPRATASETATSSAATSVTSSSGSASPSASSTTATSSEPKPSTSTAADGAVFRHMDAKDMPPKPAPPVAPQLPPQAFTKSDTGAIITAMMFVEIASYFQVTGDNAPFDELVTTSCELCNERRSVFLASKQAGRYIIAATALLEEPKITDRVENSVRVEGVLNAPVGTTYDPNAGTSRSAPASRSQYIIDLVWDEDRWLVFAAGLGGGSDGK